MIVSYEIPISYVSLFIHLLAAPYEIYSDFCVITLNNIHLQAPYLSNFQAIE